MKSTEARYGWAAVGIHWISAVLVLLLIVSGFRSGFAEDPTSKAAALKVHVPVAIAVLVLTLARLIWWWRFDRKPAPLHGQPAWQETVARWTHRALYLVLILMLGSGIAMSTISGLPNALFGSGPFPDLATLPPRAAHGAGARLMVLLIVVHGGAALYHHIVLKDETLKRMWFIRR